MNLTAKQAKLIDEFFGAMAYEVDLRSTKNHMGDLYDMERRHEVRHRASFGGNRPYGKFSIARAAKMFAVQNVLKGRKAGHTIEDLLYIKDSVLLGQAIALGKGDAINKALDRFTPEQVEEMKALNYHYILEGSV